MRGWGAERAAGAAGAELVRAGDSDGGPERVVIDSRDAGPGALFVGLPGARADGGAFAGDVLAAGAWGVLVAPEHARAAEAGRGAVLAADDPKAALGRLGRAWRRELECAVIGVTGSTGKTSTKDILGAVLAPARRTVVSQANLNTEIGLPLQILAAPAGTEVLVLEMAMRGAGQIAELAEIAEPDVGVIVNIGPVHLEQLGSIEAIAAAKAELIAGLRAGSTAIVPAHEPLLEPHLRHDLATLTFGAGGDAELLAADGSDLTIRLGDETVTLSVSFTQRHQRQNLLAALLAARAVGADPPERVEVAFSAGRGDRRAARGGVTVIDDCYNANPMSMRAALDDLVTHEGRHVAVLGDMLELGPEERERHEEIGAHAAAQGVDELIAVGPLAEAMAGPFGASARTVANASDAAEIVGQVVRPGDVVLVKASRGVGLETVVEALG